MPDSGDLGPTYFYRQLDDNQFESTQATASPWDPALQHGGPPSALLGRAIERAQQNPELLIARFSVDFFGGLPQGRLTTSATVLRPGRRIELLEATLSAGERVIAIARAWAIKPCPDAPSATPVAQPPPRSAPRPQPFPDPRDDWGYGRATEWRWVGDGRGTGRGTVWMRLRVPLVEGEEPTGLQRTLAVADSANGVGAALDFAEWLCIPPGLTVHFHRTDVGEWVLLDAETVIDANGIGLAHGRLFDDRGSVGLVTPLLLQRRPD